jgi:phosphohistidine phosphatase
MMKTLLLMRHAKSSWADAGQPDFARPLNERGRTAAPLMGRYLRQQSMKLDAVVCSPAARARETAARALAAAAYNGAVRYDARIYEASAARLLEVINETPEPTPTVLLIGHNPGLENFVRLLTGAHERIRTAAIACITIDTDAWRAVQARAGRLAWLVNPKALGDS